MFLGVIAPYSRWVRWHRKPRVFIVDTQPTLGVRSCSKLPAHFFTRLMNWTPVKKCTKQWKNNIIEWFQVVVAGFQGCSREPTELSSLIWCIPLLIQAWTYRSPLRWVWKWVQKWVAWWGYRSCCPFLTAFLQLEAGLRCIWHARPCAAQLRTLTASQISLFLRAN